MKKISLFIVIITLLTACNSKPSDTELQANIEEMEKTIVEETYLDAEKANILISNYLQYADAHQNDSLSCQYLFKALDLSMNASDAETSIDIANRLLQGYPNFEKNSFVLFAKGMIYDQKLHDLDLAKKTYQEVIDRYPESDFAESAEYSIKYLGMSDEEIIQQFQLQNEQEN